MQALGVHSLLNEKTEEIAKNIHLLLVGLSYEEAKNLLIFLQDAISQSAVIGDKAI